MAAMIKKLRTDKGKLLAGNIRMKRVIAEIQRLAAMEVILEQEERSEDDEDGGEK